jgi:hypothetical protein
MTTRCQVTTATYQGLFLIFKKYFSIIPTTYIHFIDLDDRDHLISLSKAANNNCDTNVDVTVVAPCSVGDCDGMIHEDAKFGAPSDVDCCSESITSESFDSDFDDYRSDLDPEYDATDSEYYASDLKYNSETNDPSNSDTDVELLRPASLTENEIEKHKVILNLQQRLLRLKKRISS